MGLDFECNGHYTRVGPYGYIPILKLDWTKAAIKYLRYFIKLEYTKISNDEENFVDFPEIDIKSGEKIDAAVISQYIATGNYKDIDESDLLINLENEMYLYNKLLDAICKYPNNDQEEEEIVDYKKIKDLKDDLIQSGIGGLVWINQMSCEGFLSVGQSLDILQTLERIAPYMEDTGFTDYKNNKVKTKRMDNYYLYDIFNVSYKSCKGIRLC
jgi:hypothetical protein